MTITVKKKVVAKPKNKVLNQKQRDILQTLVNRILYLAQNSECEDWTESELNYVIEEFQEEQKMLQNGYILVYRRYLIFKQPRRLDSTYHITDSFKPLSKTDLGRKILEYQDILSKL